MRTRSRSRSRWIEPIRPSSIGTCPGWVSSQTGKARASRGKLLEPGLAIVDDSHLPAYLETPNPRTIPFDERNGFAVKAESQSGSCSPVISMLREAR